MIKAVFKNDILGIFRKKSGYIISVLLLGIGFFYGFNFNISLGNDIALNAPFNIGFMIGLLSLTLIFVATVLAFPLLFKEQDANFGLIIFATPIKRNSFALTRFVSFYGLTLLAFLIAFIGVTLGINMQSIEQLNAGFHRWHFVYPLLLFGIPNALVVCSILFLIAQKSNSKLLVAVGGLFLFILYMVVMVFSNAPFMAQALPQSLLAENISALTDPFGLSAYFFESKGMTIAQRNTIVVPFIGHLLINRLFYMALSFFLIHLGTRAFSFLPAKRKKTKKQIKNVSFVYSNVPFTKVTSIFNSFSRWQSIASFFKIDCVYMFKSIALVAVSMLLLFYVGMEMYSDIDVGIRFPQQYASSGLLAQTIIGNFYYLGALVLVYFVNDLYWRSNASGFFIIQNTTYYAKEKIIGHTGSLALLVLFLTGLSILEAIVFQLIYGFPFFDWAAYWGVIVFTTFPLLLFAGFLLLINHLTSNKTLALAISIIAFLIFVTPLSKFILTNPLFRVLLKYNGVYSDFIGYGIYLPAFLWRLVFGFSLLGVFYLLHSIFRGRKQWALKLVGLIILAGLGIVASTIFLKDYNAKNKIEQTQEMVHYEKRYRQYQKLPQPTIKKVSTQINLFPNKQAYTITGNYKVVNQSDKTIDSVLINIPKDFEIKSLQFQYKNERINITSPIKEIILKKPMQPNDSAQLTFQLHYKWYPVNGHRPFNAIIANGSFMRISRYFPQFGYDAANEIQDKKIRKQYHLGKATGLKPLNAKRTTIDDFIDLDMQISTPDDQIAIGVGELTKKWKENGRNQYHYKAKAIPFRFALSSARYKTKTTVYKGIKIQVYYNPLHYQNVDRLLKNAKVTLDYCITNFGLYPFKSVIFAEVSSFTQGFNGTSYPGVIFMTENLTFHANVAADNKQDVINELAGHEVSHFWWGNNQIDPDLREGYAMLTESLAMYTQMMVFKKMYGNKEMMKQLAIQQQIYDAQKGLHKPVPLIKASKDYLDVSYNKGAIVFVKLSKLIGENTLNRALRNFLNDYKYPGPKPISTDLVKEILKVSKPEYHQQIKMFFGLK